MAKLITIPQTTLSIGDHNFGPHSVAGAIKQYIITLLQVGWPNLGGVAFSFSAESSSDGGNTWVVETSGTVDDRNVPAKFGKPALTVTIACPIRGSGNRQVRFQSNWEKSLTISGDITVN